MSDESAHTPEPEYAWAPAEPPRARRRLGWWIGAPAVALAVVAVVAASLVLIAPGTTVAGVTVGGMTPGSAAAAITQRLAETTVDITTSAGTVSVTGADLGATVNATEIASSVFETRPAWNVTQWNGTPVAVDVTVDAAAVHKVLAAAAPDQNTEPTDASVGFDSASGAYTVTPAVAGSGLDATAVTAALVSAFTDGRSSTTIAGQRVPLSPAVTTDAATAVASNLNHVLSTAGFYVGEERTVPLDAATVASWLTVSDANGALTVTADRTGIQKAVDGLAAAVDTAPVNAKIITDLQGKQLGTENDGTNGRSIGDTTGIAAAFASQLGSATTSPDAGVYRLQVAETAFQTETVSRNIDVNLTTLTTTLYENGQVVASYPVSPGKPSTPTSTGNFRIYAHIALQDMGCTATSTYCTKNVPWVSYYNGDEALHGAYWHNEFGIRGVSHGCVNMRIPDAKFVYTWAPIGTQVSVHY